MNHYRSYGLRIASALPIPLRRAAVCGEADLRIEYAGPSPALMPSGPDRRALVDRPGGWTLRYDNSGGGWIAFDHSDAERSITVSGSVAWEQCAGPLAGVVCGVLLRKRGGTALHAAGLSLHGRAFAILGGSGRGKSTLAAALIARGVKLLSEDLLVLSQSERSFKAEPGATTMSLLPDAEAAFGKSIGRRANGRDGKVEFELGETSTADSAPLTALFVLAPPASDSKPRIERLSPLAATAALMGQLYGVPWIGRPCKADLHFCSRVAHTTPVFMLIRPWALDMVPATADLLCRLVDAPAPVSAGAA